MSDHILYENLMRFLAIDAEEQIAQLSKLTPKETADKKIEDFKRANEFLMASFRRYKKHSGYCFGLSVLYGAMCSIDRLAEWQQNLCAIANWDGDPTKLDKPLIFPKQKKLKVKSAEIKTSPSPETHSRTLRTALEDFKNTVRANHAAQSAIPLPKIQITLPLLQPRTDEAIKFTVETVNQKFLAGKFDKKQLEKILDAVEGTICVVSTDIENLGHACGLSFDRTTSQWALYNSQNDHRSIETMQFVGTKKAVIEKLVNLLGASLKFRVTTLDPNRELCLPTLRELITGESSSTFVQDYGLLTLINSSPENLSELFDLAADNEKIRADLTVALTKTDKDFWEDYYHARMIPSYKYPAFTSYVFSSSTPRQYTLRTVFHEMAFKDSSRALEQLFDLALRVKDKRLCAVIFEHLNICDADNRSFFSFIVQYAPYSLPKLFKLGELFVDHSIMGESLSQALVHNTYGVTEFNRLIAHQPKYVLELVKLSEKNKTLKETLAKQTPFLFSKSLRCLPTKVVEVITLQGNDFFIKLAREKSEHLLLLTFLIDDTLCGQELKRRLQKICDDKQLYAFAEKNENLKEFIRIASPDSYHRYYQQGAGESKQHEVVGSASSSPTIVALQFSADTQSSADKQTRNRGIWGFFYYVGAIINTCRHHSHKGKEQSQSAETKNDSHKMKKS